MLMRKQWLSKLALAAADCQHPYLPDTLLKGPHQMPASPSSIPFLVVVLVAVVIIIYLLNSFETT